MRFPDALTLKDKRSRTRPLLEGIRRQWNASATEIGHRDSWQRATIAIATVNTESGEAHRTLEAVARHAGRAGGTELLDYSIEML